MIQKLPDIDTKDQTAQTQNVAAIGEPGFTAAH